MNKLIKLGNSHEGRDKFLKGAQYLIKVLVSSSDNKDLKEYLTPSFNLIRDSRKIFRLGKGINEFNQIIEKITNELAFKITPTGILDVLSKAGYFFYWFFDNLSILTKLKLINLDLDKQTKLAATFWFIGSLLTIFKLLIDLNKLLTAKQNQDPTKQDKSLDIKILNCYLNIISKVGDLFPSGQVSGIALQVLGKPFSETSVGFGGLVAAIIALKNAWESA